MRLMTVVITRMKITVVGDITFQGIQIKDNNLKANFIQGSACPSVELNWRLVDQNLKLKEIKLEIISSCLMLCGCFHLYVSKII